MAHAHANVDVWQCFICGKQYREDQGMTPCVGCGNRTIEPLIPVLMDTHCPNCRKELKANEKPDEN
jgi:DNA-directed RNA polymerase subunit RPC12/RpoP